MGRKGSPSFILFVLIGLVLVVGVTPAGGHDEGRAGYDWNQLVQIENPDWMAAVPDSLRISELSIPGTHDTISLNSQFHFIPTVYEVLWPITQRFSLADQLKIGIRALDIRVTRVRGIQGGEPTGPTYLFTVHGAIPQNGMFGADVLKTIVEFLQQHPSEAVLMRLTEQCGLGESFQNDYLTGLFGYPEWTSCGSTGHSIKSVLLNYFQETTDTEYGEAYSDYVYGWDTAQEKYVGDSNPSLWDVRGKIVILDTLAAGEYGLNYNDSSYIKIQDEFDLYKGLDHMTFKWNQIKQQLVRADIGSRDYIYINYISGVGDGPDGNPPEYFPFPYFFASGHIVETFYILFNATWDTYGGHQTWWGYSEPDCGPFTYYSGPNCVFTGMNDLLLEKWIYDPAVPKQTGRMGIVYMDFPSDILVNAIIKLNPSARGWLWSPLAIDDPSLSDAIEWYQPFYYKTIQTADIDGDGQDELLARASTGMLTYKFDAAAKAWSLLTSDDPAWSNDNRWYQPFYYETIQTGDIDGDGQDELLGRAEFGMRAYKYNVDEKSWELLVEDDPDFQDDLGWGNPKYYKTIQTADIDGDGQAELLGRGAGGMLAYKYNADDKIWEELKLNDPPLSDAAFWDRSHYYETIQTADIDGDGHDELLGRAGLGMRAYKYNVDEKSWELLVIDDPAFRDDLGWGDPSYYKTIQTADIDGDGQAELLSRGVNGMVAYGYDADHKSWIQLKTDDPAWSDAAGWRWPQYYETIQTADIDGDGQDELLARFSQGILAYNYDAADQSWTVLTTDEPAWTDALGWNKPEHYQTIQTGDIDGNGHDDLLGRGADGIIAWELIDTRTYLPFLIR